MTIEEIEKLIGVVVNKAILHQSACRWSEEEIRDAKKFMGMDGMLKLVTEQEEKIMLLEKIFENAKNTLLEAIKQYGAQHDN